MHRRQRSIAIALRFFNGLYAGAGMLFLARFRKLAGLARGILLGLLSPQARG